MLKCYKMPEKINTATYEHSQSYEGEQKGPSVRERLLASPERATAAEIPGDTVVLRLNTELLKRADSTFLSDFATEIQDENTLFTSFERQADIAKYGQGRIAYGMPMSMFDLSVVQPALRKEKTPDTLSFLYDGKNIDFDGENEIQIPSAVLAHEKMTEEQIRELRELLPAGVPLIDAKTNKLLDETGQAERESLREKEHVQRELGRESLDAYYAERVRQFQWDMTSFSGLNNTTAEEVSETPVDFEWDSWDESIDKEKQDSHYSESATQEEPRGDIPMQEQTSYPESEEVRNHRERVEKAETMLNEAAAKYGASDWRKLSPRDQERVRRQVLRQVHPDREGGDKALFQEVEYITRDIRKAPSEAAEEGNSK